jgi:HAMP domain-containing protein
VTIAYNTPDPGVTTSNNVALGDNTTSRPIEGNVGFFAVWERAMPAGEIASVYKAVRRMMLAKGIAI